MATWLDLNICVFVWILEVRLILCLFTFTAVICQDCPEPCYIPGVCVTRGRCFVRRDVNGIFYRGCADKERWKDLDISENGCSLQEYLGWNKTKALWCFCDKPLCNRRGILGFKYGAYYISVMDSSSTKSSIPFNPSRNRVPNRDNNKIASSSQEQYAHIWSGENNNNHNVLFHSGQVSMLDEKEGLDEDIVDYSSTTSGFVMNPNERSGATTDGKLMDRNVLSPVIRKHHVTHTARGHMTSSHMEYTQTSVTEHLTTLKQLGHVISNHVTTERNPELSTVNSSPRMSNSLMSSTSRLLKPGITVKTGLVEGQVEPKYGPDTTTPIMLVNLKDIINKKIERNFSKSSGKNGGSDSQIPDVEDISLLKSEKKNKHIYPNINQSKRTIKETKHQIGAVNTTVRNSKVQTLLLVREGLPQVWPEGYIKFLQGEKSGELTEINLRLENLKAANLYSKDQVGLNEDNSVLDQQDHTDTIEQVGQVASVEEQKSMSHVFREAFTTTSFGELVPNLISKLLVQAVNPNRNEQERLSSATSSSLLVDTDETRLSVNQHLPGITVNTELYETGTMDHMKDIKLHLDVTDYEVASSSTTDVKKVTSCGRLIENWSHTFPDSCPPMYTYVPRFHSCYLFAQTPANYTEAQMKCQHHHSNSRLVAIETLSEYNCLSEWLEHFPVLLDGWQGWWTGGIYNDTEDQFEWSHGGHIIEKADESWLSSLVVYPYEETCVWFVPLSMFSLGNYWCEEQSGYICELTLKGQGEF